MEMMGYSAHEKIKNGEGNFVQKKGAARFLGGHLYISEEIFTDYFIRRAARERLISRVILRCR